MPRSYGPRPVTHRPPNAASMRGLQAAMSALYAMTTEQSSEALLAERARLARDADAGRRRQGCLPLPQGE